MARLARTTVLVAALVLATAGLAQAQSSLGLGNPEPGTQPSGFIMLYMPWFQSLLNHINAAQQDFYRTLTASLKAMRSDGWQVWWLIGVSFLYGVFHAAGPGHGKAVISSYMIANETELRRGVVISFLSALVQGVVAVLVTGAGFLVLRGTTLTMTDAAKWLEVLSFGLIFAFGCYLLVRKLRGLLPRAAVFSMAGPELAVAGGGSHGHETHRHHDHHHGHDHAGHDHGQMAHVHAAGEVCEVCGHAHLPSPEMVAGERLSLADAWGAIMAVGMRPCSGAIFVLTFSFLNGLYLGGVLSVLAMSLGTAITVSILASLAVGAKDLALRYADGHSSAARISNGIEIAGALVVMLFGLTLLLASLQS